MFWTVELKTVGEETDKNLNGSSSISSLASPVGEATASSEGAGMIRAEDANTVGKEASESVRGAGCISCEAAPMGEIASGSERDWIVRSKDTV